MTKCNTCELYKTMGCFGLEDQINKNKKRKIKTKIYSTHCSAYGEY